MKLSSLAQANEVIYSKKDGNIAIRRISANHISEHNTAEVLKFHMAHSLSKPVRQIHRNWSTMILLEDLHGARRFMSMNKSLRTLFPVKSKIKTHLGLTFLLEQRSNVELKFNGKDVQPIDPFMPWENNPYYGTISDERILQQRLKAIPLMSKFDLSSSLTPTILTTPKNVKMSIRATKKPMTCKDSTCTETRG